MTAITRLEQLDLAEAYTARPVTEADLEPLVAMLNACSQALHGRDNHTLENWQQELRVKGFNPETDTLLVLAPDGEVAAFAEVFDLAPHVDIEMYGQVHPAHRGRGLGTALVAWAEQRARQGIAKAPANARVCLTAWVNALDIATNTLLEANALRVVRANHRMIIELDDAPPAAPAWPAGVSVRAFVPGQDERATFTAIRAAFRDHWGFVERPFEEALDRWVSNFRSDPQWDPGLWWLAVDAAGEVVATSLTRLRGWDEPEWSWIYSLGVTRPWRKRGLAHALLQHSFRELHARGSRKVALGVDAENLTGALRLYEHVGMVRHPRHTYQIWEKELRPGESLAVAAVQ